MKTEQQLNQQWLQLCADIATEARRQGAKAPFIFACESGLCVLDGPPFGDDGQSVRGHEVLFTLAKPLHSVIDFDAGGW